MARPKKSTRKSSSHLPKRRHFFRWCLKYLVLPVVLLGALYTVYLDVEVKQKFEGKRWELPARVYGQPLELYEGRALSSQHLAQELEALDYQATSAITLRPGEYSRSGDSWQIVTRGFEFGAMSFPSRSLHISFVEGRIARLEDGENASPIELFRLEPPLIGSFYPKHNEDRDIVPLDRVPDPLKSALIVVEDRDFFHHAGVKPTAIARALWVNLKEGRVVQGGSTITQQLVKNFYLTNERSLWRKINEAIMALLLDWHYDKETILETYLNEVYLGQSGDHGVHGVSLAAQYYFAKPIERLALHEQALLVGLVKGPSYYDPRRHAARALERRNLVLDEMARFGVISVAQLREAKGKPLGVSKVPRPSRTQFPAFMDVVKDQLRRDYRDEDIHTQGLRIFSTLQVHVQKATELAVTRQMGRFPKPNLQVAGLVVGTNSGEIMAMVGDRDPHAKGFNRALNARRQIGSLIKPVVYLTALERGYSLISKIEDEPISLTDERGEQWTPKNYDGEYHGSVSLIDALSHSYNVATVHLGTELGIDSVADRVEQLTGLEAVSRYPSLLLGAVSMTPIEVAQLYQTLAAGGFRSPVRGIQKVYRPEGEELQRYPLALNQAIKPEVAYLINVAMQWVVKEGTGKAINGYLPERVGVAGKTGTTNDARDSWFAGFTGDRLGVFWIGDDANQPIGLTGASGALRVWGETFKQLPNEPLRVDKPDNVKFLWVDGDAFARSAEFCEGAVYVPFVIGTEPKSEAPCIRGGINKLRLWFHEMFR